MARGITSFYGYTKTHKPGGTYYKCSSCSFGLFRQRGNALAMHSKAVAAIKRHAEKAHPEGSIDPLTGQVP
jgi:hypothetical protein